MGNGLTNWCLLYYVSPRTASDDPCSSEFVGLRSALRCCCFPLTLSTPRAFVAFPQRMGSVRSDSGVSDVTSTNTEERRLSRGRRVLGIMRTGLGAVWEKITADHPEPLPVDQVGVPRIRESAGGWAGRRDGLESRE